MARRSYSGGRPPCIDARRSASSSMRPRLPTGLVSWSMRSRAASAAAASSAGMEMIDIVQGDYPRAGAFHGDPGDTGGRKYHAERIKAVGAQDLHGRMQRSCMGRDERALHRGVRAHVIEKCADARNDVFE